MIKINDEWHLISNEVNELLIMHTPCINTPNEGYVDNLTEPWIYTDCSECHSVIPEEVLNKIKFISGTDPADSPYGN